MKVNQLYNAISHLKYIGLYTLYDRHEMKKENLISFSDCYDITYDIIKEGKVTIEELFRYGSSFGFNAREYTEKIPINKKLYFYRIGYKKHMSKIKDATNVVDTALGVYALVCCAVLNELFDFSNEELLNFTQEILDIFDEYVTVQPGTKMAYLNDNSIRDMFMDELDLDIWKLVNSQKLQCL